MNSCSTEEEGPCQDLGLRGDERELIIGISKQDTRKGCAHSLSVESVKGSKITFAV